MARAVDATTFWLRFWYLPVSVRLGGRAPAARVFFTLLVLRMVKVSVRLVMTAASRLGAAFYSASAWAVLAWLTVAAFLLGARVLQVRFTQLLYVPFLFLLALKRVTLVRPSVQGGAFPAVFLLQVRFFSTRDLEECYRKGVVLLSVALVTLRVPLPLPSFASSTAG